MRAWAAGAATIWPVARNMRVREIPALAGSGPWNGLPPLASAGEAAAAAAAARRRRATDDWPCPAGRGLLFLGILT